MWRGVAVVAVVLNLREAPCVLVNGKGRKKTCVWVLPLDDPGDAAPLAEFPVAVGALEWTDHILAVSALVYVDQCTMEEATEKDPLTATANRDKALTDAGALGGGAGHCAVQETNNPGLGPVA